MSKENGSLFPHTSDILSVLQKTDPGADEYEYLLKMAVIIFSAEVELEIKKIFKLLLVEYLPQLADDLANARSLKDGTEVINKLGGLVGVYKNKLRNPQIKDINEAFKYLNIKKIELDNKNEEIYNNVIKARNSIAHDPRVSITVSLQEIANAMGVGKKILEYLHSFVPKQ
jgi:hypothetical protein